MCGNHSAAYGPPARRVATLGDTWGKKPLPHKVETYQAVRRKEEKRRATLMKVNKQATDPPSGGKEGRTP